MGRANNGRTGITHIAMDMQAMWDGGETQRFHTCTLLRPDTVGQHSFGVACVIMHLWPRAPGRMLRAALKHDMAEAYTGDLPSPAKRGLGIGEAFAAYEEQYLTSVGVLPETLVEWEDWLLKMADILDGLRVCVRERSMGNRLIEHAYGNFSLFAMEHLTAPREKGFYVDSEILKRAAALVTALIQEWNYVS